MKIVKGDVKLEIPSWLIAVGIIGVSDIVQNVASAVITKKSNN